MIPFKDDNPTQTFPFLTISIIVLNTIVFIQQITSPLSPKDIVFTYGVIPYSLLTLTTTHAIHPILTLFSSMFMHGGLLHLGSNMLFLWIFGNNIEDRLGHVRFIVFYLLCGVVAAYSHALAEQSSIVPMIGASGAVSGILGAYMVLFPRAKVHTLIFLGIFVQVVRLPAIFIIGLWIVIQFFNGMLNKGIAGQSGVAWFAHIGGFLFGLIMIKIFLKREKYRD
ncbi:MAG: rhomboid family intramembrane serine protease [Nitrospirae bacterium]|nr:rhomboid family intramembrane serine protease [Nitrospirota bacterium]